MFGPRLQAAVVTLTARHRVSRRGISELARDLFGVALSTGSVDAICQRASEALAGPHLQLQDQILDQGAVHVDETGWRTRGEGRALWTATTADAAFFQIAEHCNREQFNALVGTAYPGIVISDRWNGYSHLDPDQRQVCRSHLQRDFRRHADGLGEQKTFGEKGLPLTKQVFAAWRSYQHEHHDRERLQAEITPIQTELRELLENASPKKAFAIAGTASSPTTCSRSGPRSGPSPGSTAIEPTNYSEVRVMPMLVEQRASRWVWRRVEFGIIRALRGRRAACLVGGSGRVWCAVGAVRSSACCLSCRSACR